MSSKDSMVIEEEKPVLAHGSVPDTRMSKPADKPTSNVNVGWTTTIAWVV